MVYLEEYRQEKEDLKEAYEDFYLWCLQDQGMSYSDATKALQEQNERSGRYLKNSKNIKLQISFKLKDLEKEGWGNWPPQQKLKVLWNLGMNVSDHNYYFDTRRVQEGNRRVLIDVIYGTERLDKKWINARWEDFTHKASEEARDLVRYGLFSFY